MCKLWWAGLCAAGVMAFAGAAQAATFVYDFSDQVKFGPGTTDPTFTKSAHPDIDPLPENAGPITITLEYGGGVVATSASLDFPYKILAYRFIEPGQTQVLHDTFSGDVFCSTDNGCLNVISPGLLTGQIQIPSGSYDPACEVPGANAGRICAERFLPTFVGASLRFQISGGTPDPNNPDVVDCPGCFARFTIEYGSATPEPVSWALMLCGFGLVGAALRRRRLVWRQGVVQTLGFRGA